MTTAASQLGKDRRSPPSPPPPRQDVAPCASTGSTPARRRQLRVPGQRPKPLAERKMLFMLGAGHTPPNRDIPSHPSGAHGAGSGGAETLGFRGGSACSHPSAVTQLMPQYGQVSPPAAALASPGPGWQSIPLSDTMSPDHPNHPGGGQGGRWASGWQSPLPQSPQLWGQWSCWGLQVWRYPTLTRASPRAALAPSSPVRPHSQPSRIPGTGLGRSEAPALRLRHLQQGLV